MKFDLFPRSGSPLAACVLGFALSALSANAAWIVPIGATASSSETGSTPSMVIDGSGLSAESTSGLHAAGASTSWSMDQGNLVAVADEFITIDLGALYDLTSLHIWQFTRNTAANDTNRGVKIFDVLVSADNLSFTEVLSNQTLNKPIDTLPVIGTPDGNEPVQSFALIQTGVRYVQLGIDSTYESAGTNDWQGGLGEVRFEGVAAVPEPSASLLGGIGMLLLLRRRR